jgi:hypothetical protein
MKFKEIKISDTISFYITNLSNINNFELIKDLKFNMRINKKTSVESVKEPGIQSYIILKTKAIKNLNTKIYKKIFKFLNYNTTDINLYFSTEWVYVSSKNNNWSRFHTHTFSDTLKANLDWSFVYYAQMPDNLNEQEGKILFRTNEGIEVSYLPQVGDLILFPANLLHKPELNRSSDIERIVYAGGFTILDYTKDYGSKKNIY